jgi:uncharacterized membrane protein YfcA
MVLLVLIVLLLVGALGGFLAGLLGVGGGLIFIPIISLLLENHHLSNSDIVRFTLANSIALVFISGLSGILRQIKIGSYELKQSLLIGIPGALSAAAMSYAIQHGNWYSKERFQTVFLGFLIISISNMLFVTDKSEAQSTNFSKPTSPKNNFLISTLVGILAGSVVSLSGLGGGIIMVPMFRMLLKFPVKRATSLSLSIVPLLSIFPLTQYLINSNAPSIFKPEKFTSDAFLRIDFLDPTFLQSNYIIWPYFLPMAIGAFIFSSFGQKVAPKVPVIWIRVIFALLSASILIKTLYELF